MRVIRREPDPVPDGDVVESDSDDDTPDADTTADDRTSRRRPLLDTDRFRRDRAPRADHDADADEAVVPDRDGDGRDDRTEAVVPDRDGDGRDDRDEAVVPDRDDDGRDDRTETGTTPTVEREVVSERWSLADALIAFIGAGLAIVGALVLIRTGVDASWFRPVETVADARHTPLLGAIELGAGVLLMLTPAAPGRALPALTGLGIAIAGVLAAIENDEVSRELAIEERWAWMMAGVGLLVTIIALVPPRRRRVERLVES